MMSTRQFNWCLLAGIVLLAGCPKPGERQVAAPPAQVAAPAPLPQPQLTYRERKAAGLLTPEELQDERELAQVKEDIAAGNVDRRVREVKKVEAAPSGSRYLGVEYPEVPKEQQQPVYSPPASARRALQSAPSGSSGCPQGGAHVPGKTDRNGRLHCAKCGRFM